MINVAITDFKKNTGAIHKVSCRMTK